MSGMMILDTMEPVVMMVKKRVPDGEGGFIVDGWAEDVEFKATISKDDSINAMTAEKEGVTGVYTVITPAATILEDKDVFKRLSDGKIFRVTTDGTDKKTPKKATLQIRKVHAEEWRLT